jgi:hypothetical protein
MRIPPLDTAAALTQTPAPAKQLTIKPLYRVRQVASMLPETTKKLGANRTNALVHTLFHAPLARAQRAFKRPGLDDQRRYFEVRFSPEAPAGGWFDEEKLQLTLPNSLFSKPSEILGWVRTNVTRPHELQRNLQMHQQLPSGGNTFLGEAEEKAQAWLLPNDPKPTKQTPDQEVVTLPQAVMTATPLVAAYQLHQATTDGINLFRQEPLSIPSWAEIRESMMGDLTPKLPVRSSVITSGKTSRSATELSPLQQRVQFLLTLLQRTPASQPLVELPELPEAQS